MVLYLLHADAAKPMAGHYAGVTTNDRLDARMHEHALGRGASLTSRWFTTATPVWLVYVQPIEDWAAERRVKNNGHLRKLCPICRYGIGVLKEPLTYPQIRLIEPPPVNTLTTTLSW